MLSFLGTKNQDYKHNFFLEILKTVYLSFDWVPKLIKKSFQAMEQNLVQRCETKVLRRCLQGIK